MSSRSPIASKVLLVNPLLNGWKADPPVAKLHLEASAVPQYSLRICLSSALGRNRNDKRNPRLTPSHSQKSAHGLIAKGLYRTLLDNRIVCNVHFPLLSQTSDFSRSRCARLTCLSQRLFLLSSSLTFAPDGFLVDWFNMASETQAEQPHWITSLNTTTPRLAQEFRCDIQWQTHNSGVTA